MAYRAPDIEIPKTDIWSALFSRPSKPFPDSQGKMTSPLLPSLPLSFPHLPEHSNLPKSRHGEKLHLLPLARYDHFIRKWSALTMGLEKE
jgi:hypothetical protein